jgi:Domain of unknown function (DUF3427)
LSEHGHGFRGSEIIPQPVNVAGLGLPLTHPEVPLGIHARYTRVEILAAFGIGTTARVAPWQSGVYWAADAQADLFAFTLDKTSGSFSPTTRYKDYAISRDLIHWESQSVTRAESPTGQRYQRHADRGTSVMLFARQRSDERAFYFLGPATYVKHESELPMAITWRLHHPLPGDLFAAFAAAVARAPDVFAFGQGILIACSAATISEHFSRITFRVTAQAPRALPLLDPLYCGNSFTGNPHVVSSRAFRARGHEKTVVGFYPICITICVLGNARLA